MELKRSQQKVVSLSLGDRQPSARIHLLGVMRATSYLGEDLIPRGKKARAVLGYLCLNPGQYIPRSRLAALLWDRVPEQQARTSLRQAIREISQAMSSLAGELIIADNETIKFETRSCWIDALAITSTDPLPVQSLRSDLAALCVGELLEDLSGITSAFDQWLLIERANFTSRLTQVLEGELNQLCQTNTDPNQRAALARRVISFDPTHEGASRILMRALADTGERGQVLREYERCRMALRTALDVEPSSETQALYKALKTFSGASHQETLHRQEADESTVFLSSHLIDKRNISPVSPRLRVGVLPFQGHNPDIESLAFSLSQEVAAALARFRWFDVIAPISFPQKLTASKSENIIRRKQWHYIVDGTLMGGDDRINISVRLLDLCQEARPVWSDRFELAADALDQVHERVIAPIVARIDPVILFIEGQPSRQPRSGATGLVLQAMPLVYSSERVKFEEAGRLIAEAIRIDPENAKAAAWGAYWHAHKVGQGWAEDPLKTGAESQKLALRAINLDPENAEALGIYAHFSAFLDKDYDSALQDFERALRLNPNSAFVWAMSAPTYCYIGQPDKALQHLDRYRDLAPFDPNFRFMEGIYTIAYTFKGEYEKAVKVGRRAVKANPTFSNDYKPLIAALGHLGRKDEAAPYIQKLLSLEPKFTVEQFGKTYPFQRDEDRQRYMRGLELAGVPLS